MKLKLLDRILRYWRNRLALRYVSEGVVVLDIGCADDYLARLGGTKFKRYVGIDPLIESQIRSERVCLIRGKFPASLAPDDPFDVIFGLATVEHIPIEELNDFIQAIYKFLKPSGRVILTIPSPKVDSLLSILVRLGLIAGMSLEQHTALDPSDLIAYFLSNGFHLERYKRFQLGFNNLLILRKKVGEGILP